MPASSTDRPGPLARARAAVKRLAYRGWRRDRWQRPERVLEALGLAPGDRVADLGAGGGYFTVRLAEVVGSSGRVYAVETDPDMVADLRRTVADRGLANVTVVGGEDGDPGLPEPVDLVLVVNAYHHLPEPVGYLRGVARHLRPGGRVAIVEVLPQGLWGLLGHATDPAAVRAGMQAAGYQLAAEHGFLPRQSLLVFRRADAAGS